MEDGPRLCSRASALTGLPQSIVRPECSGRCGLPTLLLHSFGTVRIENPFIMDGFRFKTCWNDGRVFSLSAILAAFPYFLTSLLVA